MADPKSIWSASKQARNWLNEGERQILRRKRARKRPYSRGLKTYLSGKPLPGAKRS
jgi:hypothetical protein